MKYVAIVASILLIGGLIYADDFTGARPLGLGRAFVGVADDANALDWNVAGIASFQYMSFTASFNKLFAGISGDNIGMGHLSLVSQYRTLFGYGLSWRYLFSNVYSEHHIKLGLAHRFGWKKKGFFGKHPFSIGAALRIDGVGYNLDNATPPDQNMITSGEGVDPRNDPVFASGTSKWGFSVDAGVLWRFSPKISIGAAAYNLLQPNLALNTGEENGKLPMQLRFGIGFSPNKNMLIAGDVRYYQEGGNVITPHIGIEQWFYKHMFGIRAGYDVDELTLGIGWRLKRHWSFGFDYALVYPLNELSKAGATSHKFSAIFNLPNPIPAWDFAAISVEPKIKKLKPGDQIDVSVTFKNLSAGSAKNVNYSVYTRKPDGTYALLKTGTIPKMKTGQEVTVVAKFQDFLPGEYTIYAAIDDDGTALPKINSKVSELDEGNNVAENTVRIFPGPKPSISFEQDTLHITRITFQETEEPVLPIIFFDPKSADIPDRYKRVLDKLADRISNNPDVVVRIAGYFDDESDGKDNIDIAKKREQAIYNYLKARVKNPDQLVIDTKHDYAKKRAGTGKRYIGIERYLPMIRHENRRVELSAEMPKLAKSQIEQIIKFKKGQIHKKVDFSANAMTYKTILEKNPDVMLLVEGYATKDEAKPTLLEPSFLRAADIKEQIKKVVPFYLWDRIFAWGEDRFPADEPHVKISLLADGVLYKPFPGRKIPKGITVGNPQNKVLMSVKSDNPVVSHRAELYELGGGVVKLFKAGSGEPPATLPWDWKMDNGKYIEGGKFYYGKLTATDELGAVGEAVSETLVVDQVDKVYGEESRLLVVFRFDKDVAISPYYHSRMEAIAKRIIELGERGGEPLTIAITGHTDIIGLRRRNQELSVERAVRELKNLRIYLRHMLNLKSDKEVTKWLKDHKLTLISEGHGPDRPYTLKKMRDDGTTYDKMIGDNKVPEGRQFNRRVQVEFRAKKAKGRRR